jgi:hypothetical protein
VTFTDVERAVNRLSTPLRLLRALVAVFVLAACTGDEPPRAEVNGQTYAVGPVRGLRITEADLQYFGSVGRTNAEAFFLNGEVLTLDDVDPETLLLVRAAPALRDDPDDPWGPYVGLWGGGKDADLCSYAEASAVAFCE